MLNHSSPLLQVALDVTAHQAETCLGFHHFHDVSPKHDRRTNWAASRLRPAWLMTGKASATMAVDVPPAVSTGGRAVACRCRGRPTWTVMVRVRSPTAVVVGMVLSQWRQRMEWSGADIAMCSRHSDQRTSPMVGSSSRHAAKAPGARRSGTGFEPRLPRRTRKAWA